MIHSSPTRRSSELAVRITGIRATSIRWRRSENSAELANAFKVFLNNDVLAAADPYLEPGVDPSRLTVAAVLAHAGTRLDSNSIHNPAARARIGLTLGRAWFGLGVWDKARMRLEAALADRSEEHTSELQSLMRISYAVFCLKKKNK